MLATSFFGAAFETVIIGGNALHTREEFGEFVDALRSHADVYHFTLDPSLEEIVRRVQTRGADKTEEWLEIHVGWMREKYGEWTSVIDNSAVTPHDTVQLVADRIAAGEGLLASHSAPPTG